MNDPRTCCFGQPHVLNKKADPPQCRRGQGRPCLCGLQQGTPQAPAWPVPRQAYKRGGYVPAGPAQAALLGVPPEGAAVTRRLLGGISICEWKTGGTMTGRIRSDQPSDSNRPKSRRAAAAYGGNPALFDYSWIEQRYLAMTRGRVDMVVIDEASPVRPEAWAALPQDYIDHLKADGPRRRQWLEGSWDAGTEWDNWKPGRDVA